MYKNILLSIFLAAACIAPRAVSAQDTEPAITDSTVRAGNHFVDAVINGIYTQSNQIYELKQFSSRHVRINKWGFKAIHFTEVPKNDSSREPLHFGLSIVPLDVMEVFEGEYQTAHFTFPFLGIKITAFQEGETRRRVFDLTELIREHGLILLDHQQTFMPFRMSITSPKTVYKVGEPVKFTVRLTNASSFKFQAYRLTTSSLHLQINGAQWGYPEGPEKRDYKNEVVINPGEFIEREFDITAPSRTDTITIVGYYHMSFKGVSPTAVLELDVIR